MREGIYKYLTKKIGFVLFILSIYILLISHWLACIFLLLEYEGLKASVDEIPKHAISARYVSVLYFLIATSCTVGYGDTTVNHNALHLVQIRYLYQIFLMLASVIGNAVFFSLIFTTTRNADAVTSGIQNDVEEFEDFLSRLYWKMMPNPELNRFYRVAINFYKFAYFFNIGKIAKQNDYIDKIAINEENTILDSLSFDTRRKFEIFLEPLSESTIRSLVFSMEPQM